MQDDKTVIKVANYPQEELDSERTVLNQPGLQVSVVNIDGSTVNEYFFTHGFTAGRAQDNDIVMQSENVSRHHLEVKREYGDWWIYDLNSANGIYIQNRLVEHKSKLQLPVSVSLGKSAGILKIQQVGQRKELGIQIIINDDVPISEVGNHEKSGQRTLSKEAIKAHYLEKKETENGGDFTQLFRTLIRQDRVSRSKNYKKWISLLGFLVLLTVSLVVYQRAALLNARTLAIDMFYDIKTLEVSMSQSEIMIEKSAEVLEQTIKAVANEKKLKAEQKLIKAEQEKIAVESKRLAQERKKLRSMKAKYKKYAQVAESLRFRLPFTSKYEEELITKVAREFGESELEVPDDFVAEVKRYIKYWQSSSRMRQAMANLEKNNYAPTIVAALEKEGLPLSFIYLPLQESQYDTLAIGPETPYGVAKGAWQFLASTGKEFGLTPGPLEAVREYDEKDARFDFDKATRAGAKYLKQIYSTEAQASGLLVMASYNYGHNRVRGMIKKMPDNPRDKNFWKFIQQYQIPKETYDYVFYVFSAAVIGEDPKYFGFNFTSPLSLFTTEQDEG